MRTKSTGGFTLIELLIVIAIIGILAAVLIPNLLNARERAFDTAAQTCLKELSVAAEVQATIAPFDYENAAEYSDEVPAGINACANVTVTGGPSADFSSYEYVGQRDPSPRSWIISTGTGVLPN